MPKMSPCAALAGLALIFVLTGRVSSAALAVLSFQGLWFWITYSLLLIHFLYIHLSRKAPPARSEVVFGRGVADGQLPGGETTEAAGTKVR